MRALTIEQLSYPQCEPVTPGEAAFQCRVDCDDDIVAAITPLIVGARAHVEDLLNGAIIEQRVRAGYEYNQRGYREIVIPRPPLLSVERVFWLDGYGTEWLVDPSAYTISRSSRFGAYLRFKSTLWTPNCGHTAPLYVDFKAGYGADAEHVPPPIKQAILLLVDDWFSNTATVDSANISTRITQTVARLLSHYRQPISI